MNQVTIELDEVSQEDFMCLTSQDGSPINIWSTGQILVGDASLQSVYPQTADVKDVLDWIDQKTNEQASQANGVEVMSFWTNAKRKFVSAPQFGFKDIHELPRIVKDKRLTLGLSDQGEAIDIDVPLAILIPMKAVGVFGSGMVVNPRGHVLYLDKELEGIDHLRVRFLDFENLPDDINGEVKEILKHMMHVACDIMSRAVKVDPKLVDIWQEVFLRWFP